MKKDKKRNEFLAELRKIPIIQVACEKVGLSRTSIYRWKDDDLEFKKEMEQAMADGEAYVNDMSESQLLTLIKEKDWSAISFWLRHHHNAYKNKIEITTKNDLDETLSPEQEELVRKALNLAGGQLETNNVNQNQHEQNQSKQLPEESERRSDNSTGVSGRDGEGQESANSGNQEKS